MVDTLVAARIPVTEVNDTASLLADAHARARGAITTLEHPTLGTVHVPSPAPHLSGTPARITRSAPALAADQDAVLHDWLGSDRDGADVRRDGRL